jgi:hypothetical protein
VFHHVVTSSYFCFNGQLYGQMELPWAHHCHLSLPTSSWKKL